MDEREERDESDRVDCDDKDPVDAVREEDPDPLPEGGESEDG